MGRCRPRRRPERLGLGPRAGGDTATVDTPAGLIVLRHPEAAPTPGRAEKNKATYPKALPGGVDLTLAPTPDGFKETVTLPDAKAPATYLDEFALPEGVTARQGEGGVEFVDAEGTVLGVFRHGVAYDAAFPGAGVGATAPVSTRLLSQEASKATVEVSVSPEWVADPQRTFPVTVDPAFTRYTTPGNGSRDTFVLNGSASDISYSAHPWLVVGNPDGGIHKYRSLLYFNLDGLPTGPDVFVDSFQSYANVYSWHAPTCTPTPMEVWGLGSVAGGGAFADSVTWNSQPPVAGVAPVSTSSFAKGPAGCPAGRRNLDIHSVAQGWLHGTTPNNGIELKAANEADTSQYKAFYSGDSGYGDLLAPFIHIVYNRQPSAITPVAPAAGARLATTTPMLSVTPSTDPEGGPLFYLFTVSTNPDAETGGVVNSGWLNQPSFAVPPGRPARRDDLLVESLGLGPGQSGPGANRAPALQHRPAPGPSGHQRLRPGRAGPGQPGQRQPGGERRLAHLLHRRRGGGAVVHLQLPAAGGHRAGGGVLQRSRRYPQLRRQVAGDGAPRPEAAFQLGHRQPRTCDLIGQLPGPLEGVRDRAPERLVALQCRP